MPLFSTQLWSNLRVDLLNYLDFVGSQRGEKKTTLNAKKKQNINKQRETAPLSFPWQFEFTDNLKKRKLWKGIIVYVTIQTY